MQPTRLYQANMTFTEQIQPAYETDQERSTINIFEDKSNSNDINLSSIPQCTTKTSKNSHSTGNKVKVDVIWSIYDKNIPAPKAAKIAMPMHYGIWLADTVLDRCPRAIQQLAWSYLSGSTYPCPSKSLVTGDLVTLSEKGILRFLLDKLALEDRKNHPPMLHFRLGPIPAMMPLDADMVVKILNSEHMEKGFAYERLSSFFGKGLFTSKIEQRWKDERKIVRQLFFHQMLAEIAPLMHKTLITEAHRLCFAAEGKPVELNLMLTRMALLTFCTALLGVDVQDIANEFAPDVNHVLAYLNASLEPIDIPFGENYDAFWHHRQKVYDWVRVVIERVYDKADQGEAPQNALVSKILQMRAEETDDELVELVTTLIITGHEATSKLMTTAIYAALRYPRYIKQVRHEAQQLAACLQNFEENKSNSFLQRALPRIHSIIDETLRLFPPAWLIARSPVCDLEINGQKIYKGSQILINLLALNRLQSNWGEDAEAFYPERFDHMSNVQKKKFFPFAAGIQRCPGDNFARREAALAIAMLFDNFDLSLADPDQTPDPTSISTFRLFNELHIFLKPRK